MSVLIIVGVVIVYCAGTWSSYRLVRYEPRDHAPVSDFLMCALLWWMVLPIFGACAANEAAKRREKEKLARKKAKPLQSGSANGLYDDI